jgi:hypothetical protein
MKFADYLARICFAVDLHERRCGLVGIIAEAFFLPGLTARILAVIYIVD